MMQVTKNEKAKADYQAALEKEAEKKKQTQ
jgi:hypothetical protein